MRRRTFLAATGLTGTALVLPQTRAAAVTTAPRAARLVPLQPRMADALVDSYMVNTKMFYADKVYGHTEAVVDLLKELGVRIVRERLTTGRSQGTKNQQWAFPRLAAAGTRWHATVGELGDHNNAIAVNREAMRFQSATYGSDLSSIMHSFGGCNEIDGQGDAAWAAHARTMQQALWNEATANSATNAVPVAGPSTRTDFTHARAADLGNLSAWSDWGNGHLYNKGRSPTAEIDEHLQILDPVFPQVDNWIITETGYNNSPQDNTGRTVPEEASAVYALRGICDFFKRRAVYGRFELLDDPDPIDYRTQQTINNTAEREAHFGLIAMTKGTHSESSPSTWRRKPEFNATKNLLHLLADPGADFAPSPIEVSITGGGADLQQLLLQKRNGKHYLLLWRDVQVADPYPSGDMLSVNPVRVDVTLGAARPLAFYRPNNGPEPTETLSARTSFSLNLRGSLKVVEIG